MASEKSQREAATDERLEEIRSVREAFPTQLWHGDTIDVLIARIEAEEARAEQFKKQRDAEIERVKLLDTELQAEKVRADALQQQVELWAQEARTQSAIVRDCYAAAGAQGIGDWNGANPVRERIAELEAGLEAVEEFLSAFILSMDQREPKPEPDDIPEFRLLLLKVKAARGEEKGSDGARA